MNDQQITVIANDGSYVHLGILAKHEGREYWHYYNIDGAMAGHTEPSERVSQVSKDDVTVLMEFDYDKLLEFHNRATEILIWHKTRQNIAPSRMVDWQSVSSGSSGLTVSVFHDSIPVPSPGSWSPLWPSASVQPQVPFLAGQVGPSVLAGSVPVEVVSGSYNTQSGVWAPSQWQTGPATNPTGLGVSFSHFRKAAATALSTFSIASARARFKIFCDRDKHNEDKPHGSGEGEDREEWVESSSDQAKLATPQEQEPLTDFQQPATPPTPETAQETAPVGDEPPF